jgi:hypothetical protein
MFQHKKAINISGDSAFNMHDLIKLPPKTTFAHAMKHC